MIKKLLLTSALFLLIFASSLTKTQAQGTFSCTWKVGTNGGCLVGKNNCDTANNYQPDSSACTKILSNILCNGTTSKTCISKKPSTVTSSTNSRPADSSSTSDEAEPTTCSTNDGSIGINTAIGCIPFDSEDSFLGFFLSWAIGIGGGIAFLLILLAGFQITTSSGNPERLKAGQELLTSAIAGLIMLIFSVFILRVIGVGVLGLDRFGFGN